jgi:hemolysin III
MPEERQQSVGEEIANSISHGVGWLALVALVPVLIVATVRTGGTASVVGASIFAGAVLAVYLASTLYHALPRSRAKRVFQSIDHITIFILIAATYTPFTLGILRGPWGWTLFGIVWGLCLAGVLMKLFIGANRAWKLSLVLYLFMGWLAIVAVKPVLEMMPAAGIALIFGGGIAYTLGVPFLLAKRVRYSHLVWHLFVMGGSACHFIAVARYAE